ncbi:Acetyltransferase (GNAT) family protein [Sporomusa ovata DSM 2662]|uniref:GCN5-related N-acetyltransferase n=1 Tax=Sporomusa ovata TaxID=2378 RepID=A0A0U1KZL9_9FIRM|nr:GNAT family N-acetyltransferase [Sporomusa ovata]EQB27911.1 acetyltransferase GNAT family [Sporomusa ovata DSM 2662]CQR72846.1 GCN5-related N-acetyltransferase [Sporomusa ovata]
MSHTIIDVIPENILEIGIFCVNGTKYKEGIKRKELWYKQRYAEGLRIKISVNQDNIQTGMIEYVPGKYAWRTIHAEDYTVIHCLQVSRSQTHQGYGSALLNACIEELQNADGIALVTSSKPWVNDKKFFVKKGFKQIGKAEPYYELLVKQFRKAALPTFNVGWEERALTYGKGLTVFYSNQCPIIEDTLKNLKEAAKECNIEIHFCKINSAEKAQKAPFVYGTFGVLLNGQFLTHRVFDKDRYVRLLKSKTRAC